MRFEVILQIESKHGFDTISVMVWRNENGDWRVLYGSRKQSLQRFVLAMTNPAQWAAGNPNPARNRANLMDGCYTLLYNGDHGLDTERARVARRVFQAALNDILNDRSNY